MQTADGSRKENADACVCSRLPSAVCRLPKGFTLVELLVVISIIAMLAGLLLPAINAARENGRRAQCISNQRQVAFALFNYDTTKGHYPALRAPLRQDAYVALRTAGTDDWLAAPAADRTDLTWVGFLLPFIEQNTAWNWISSGTLPTGDKTLYDMVIPVLQCKSGSITPGDNRLSYVVNAGPLNLHLNGNPTNQTEYFNENHPIRDAKMFTIFFDHFTSEGYWNDFEADWVGPQSYRYNSVEYISSKDGTSNTILLSENENAGNWIWYAVDTNLPVSMKWDAVDDWEEDNVYPSLDNLAGFDFTRIESSIAFCYPGYREFNSYAEPLLSDIATGEVPTYIPLQGMTDAETSPLFINEGRPNSNVSFTSPTRTARPSSGHPGVVVAAFCDGATRVLRDDMDKTLFVRLCRPSSGVILNPKDLDF